MVPPLLQELGGVDWGPNTVNVTWPVGSPPPETLAVIDDGAIWLPATADSGAAADTAGKNGVPLMSRPRVSPDASW
jgi:hypothetical protein